MYNLQFRHLAGALNPERFTVKARMENIKRKKKSCILLKQEQKYGNTSNIKHNHESYVSLRT